MEGKLPFKVEGNIIRTEGQNIKFVEKPIGSMAIAEHSKPWFPSNISPMEKLISTIHEVGRVKDPYLNIYPKSVLGSRWRELTILNNPTRLGPKSYEKFTKGVQLSSKDNMHDFIIRQVKAKYKKVE